MKGLVIESKWVDLILEGKKTWEMRSTATSIRGDVALIKKGSGHIYGLAKISGVRGPLMEFELSETRNKHQVPAEIWQPFEDFKWRYAWELESVMLLDSPVAYDHPNGAVIWVNLSNEVINELSKGSSLVEPVAHAAVSQVAGSDFNQKPAVEHAVKIDRTKPEIVAPFVDDEPFDTTGYAVREIELSQGNINNGHFYLRAVKDWLPTKVIGGSNKASIAPEAMEIDWGGPGLAVSDVAGDKMIFRSRGWVRAFFEKFHLKSGDAIQLIKTGEMSLRIRPAKN